MKKVMFVGETGAGKSSLISVLSGQPFKSSRALAVEYHGRFINTPGEFLENRWFYRALITASSDCSFLVFVQDATRPSCLFPPLFASAFNRTTIGVISKIDEDNAHLVRAERFLTTAGVRNIVQTSARFGTGLEDLTSLLE